MNNLQTPRNPRSADDFSDAELRRVAQLTRLALEEGEKEELIGNLRRIIGFVQTLQQLDTEGVEPMVHPLDPALSLRADEVTETDVRADAQACAPDVVNGLYRVPKVIE